VTRRSSLRRQKVHTDCSTISEEEEEGKKEEEETHKYKSSRNLM
jgi:hypothetical protein